MLVEEIIDRWQNPQFAAGSSAIDYRIGAAENPVCGDSCTMFVKLENGIVTDARHCTYGCTLTIVPADLLCENLIGKPIDFEINLFELLGIPIGLNRRQCVLTPTQAFHEALR